MDIAIRYFTKSKKGNTEKLANVVSKALNIEALDVSKDLDSKADKLILINAMYAADIDKEVKEFLSRNNKINNIRPSIPRNKDKIREIYNMNTSASGSSTWKNVKKVADSLQIKLSDKEFHCAASWIFINKGLPTEDDYKKAENFVLSL